MMAVENLMSLLVTTLLLTGVRGRDNSVFVYSTVGGEVLLPCATMLLPNCSCSSWIFYKGGQVRYSQEVIGGEVQKESDKSSRLSVASDCSLRVRDLKAEDAGSYQCEQRLTEGGPRVQNTNVYLSLLSISSPSLITDLRPGRNLSLGCILFSYYDAGTCKSYTETGFSLSWVAEDGAGSSRYDLINYSRCSVTLVTELQKEDNNRKWTCRLCKNTGNDVIISLDFRSTFVLQNPFSDPSPISSTPEPDAVQLPISRFVLCAALPLMVLTVAFFTWRGDRKRAKAFATGIELQQIN
uniref:uncharacterized protein n=1 Tax=Centroberyx gerrardi TaxID=166262 RepID=UPI003AB00819